MILNGTTYHDKTPMELAQKIEQLREQHIRVVVVLGDPATKKPWGDVQTGYIGRSMGPVKVPLAIHNARSMGGDALDDDCVLEIRYANKRQGGVIYKV